MCRTTAPLSAPLKGARVVVTRSAEQAQELAAALQQLGADVVILPAIEIVPPGDSAALREAARAVGNYEWIVFTSVNAVNAFADELATPPHAIRAEIVCVGSATARVASTRGFPRALTPERYVSESVLPCFPPDLSGQRVLIPRSALARDVIPDELRRRGAEVTVIEAYRNATPEATTRDAPLVFASPPDWVLFASSSAVDHICDLVGTQTLSKSRLASIGPLTTASLAKHGLAVSAEADPHTVPGLVQALRRCYEVRSGIPMP